MIDINLIKNQLPTKIDLPASIKLKQRILIFSIIGLAILMLLPAGYYTSKLIKTTKAPQKKITVQKEEHIESKQKEEKTTEVKEHKEEHKQKHPINHKQKETVHKEEKPLKAEEEHQKPAQTHIALPPQDALFKIEIALEDIPQNTFKDNLSQLPPLPKSLKPQIQPKDNKTTKKAPSPFYEVKIKTYREKQLKALLKKLNVSYKEKAKKIKASTKYDIYVGGLYSYPDTLKFANILKSKGYKVYSITNINLLFYVCVDKMVNKNKAYAYKKAWSKTKFKIILKKRYTKKTLYEFTFTTTDKTIIKTLKKNGFWPIIRLIKNGA
ncbi:hypothetical protein [Hippea sp. KM1]|uniref:hypothetical protein n=1 Tax=Hippea sp. KM1 TaxID=944481 RepID=UPI00046CEB01|nr:hypothetical protein [Hippea sp. KM1]